jgi:hypothetical protein
LRVRPWTLSAYRVRISGSLFAICECKFAFCERKIIHFANGVLQKQCVKGWFSQSFRIYFTIMEYFADYYCNFVLKGCVKWRIWLQFLQKIYKICYETTAILLFASSVSTFQNWNFLHIFKKEICESILPV